MASILVLFHSQEHGNTEAMAGAVAEGIQASGAQARLINTNESRLDIAEYRDFDAAAFGTPDYYSYVAGGVKMFKDDWYIARKDDPAGLEDKPFALFLSHGGGGAALAPFEKLFNSMGTKVGETVVSSGAPDEQVLAACRALGQQLTAAVN